MRRNMCIPTNEVGSHCDPILAAQASFKRILWDLKQQSQPLNFYIESLEDPECVDCKNLDQLAPSLQSAQAG